MAYGLKILNSSGRTVIDSERSESLLYATTSNTATGGSDFPTTGWSGSDLILARPATTATGSQGFGGFPKLGRKLSNNKWGRGLTGFPTSANGNGGGNVVWRELKAQSASSLTPASYGLVVYDGTGTSSSDILFSATDLDITATVVAQGKFNGTAGSSGAEGFYQEFTMDSSLDQGRYYVLMTNSASVYVSGSRGANSRFNFNYQFNYTAGTIRMLNFMGVGNTRTALSSNLDWVIFYVRNGGSVDDNFAQGTAQR